MLGTATGGITGNVRSLVAKLAVPLTEASLSMRMQGNASGYRAACNQPVRAAIRRSAVVASRKTPKGAISVGNGA